MKFKSHIIFIVLLLLCAKNSYSQWTSQVSNTTHSIRSVFFDPMNASNGWCITASGEVLRTINGGLNWNIQSLTGGAALEDIVFINSSVGYTIGAYHLFKTIDSGITWIADTSIVTQYYWEKAYFINQNNGWIVGNNGGVIHTNDGGLSWINCSLNNTPTDLRSCWFTSNTDGFAVGDFGKIIKTVDGGITWSTISTGTTQDLYDITFNSPTEGWIVGDFGKILHTVDGGLTWTNQNSGSNVLLRSINVLSSGVIWVCGDDGTILYSSNGGNLWSSVQSNTNEVLFQIYFCNSSIGFCVGDAGTILYTSNSGNTGINEIDSKNTSIVFPNPVPMGKSITIKYELPKESKSGTIEIHKISGGQIESISIGPAFTDITVPVASLCNGVYLYTVKSDNGAVVSTGKFIVNK